MQVPFMDLKRQYLKIKDEIDEAIQETIDACAFVSGKMVRKFEEDFAQYCGVKYAVGVSNGTSALFTALKALDIGPGDGVITVSFTFIATVEAISMTGARPLFVDIDTDTYNISVSKLKEYIENFCEWDSAKKMLVDKKHRVRIKAVIPVHLYGQMADMDPIMDIAKEYDLYVIEDAAQAHGATYKGKKAGSIGHLAAFSFYPSKNLGAYGQGGAVLTNDENLASKMRMFIDHGQRERYDHAIEGWNFRMDGFQAAILDIKLKHLDDWNKSRAENASLYHKYLNGLNGLRLPTVAPDNYHIYHLYVVHSKTRSVLQDYLKEAGIGSSIHYPVPVHLQGAYRYLGYKKGDLPVSERSAEGVLSLPMFPELTQEEIKYVCDKLKEWSL